MLHTHLQTRRATFSWFEFAPNFKVGLSLPKKVIWLSDSVVLVSKLVAVASITILCDTNDMISESHASKL